MTKEEIKQSKIRKRNMKLFPVYEAIGLDYIFYYGIEVLFLSQVKQMSDSNIVLLSSLYAIFSIIFQIPMCVVINKLGKRKSILYGNTLKLISIIIIGIGSNFTWIIIAQLMKAVGFTLTGPAENPLLTSSIPETNYKAKIFSKIYGKGYSKYCYMCAISTILSGYLYTINPYIPIFLCGLTILISTIIAYNFIEIEEDKKFTINENVRNIKEGFKEIFKSERLKALLLMTGTIWGLLCLLSTYQTTLLKNMNISATYIGIIAAIVQIISGISSKKANEFNERNKNTSLTKMALGITLGAVIIGGIVLLKIPIYIQVLLICVIFCVRHTIKGYFQILKCRYMGNFASDEILTKIYASNAIISNLTRALIEYIGSVVLLYNDIKVATLIVGCIFTAVCVLISIYMKNRVGVEQK